DLLGEISAGLEGQLPGGHEKSIVATLLQSVRLLKQEGLSLLRLACELQGGTPIPARRQDLRSCLRVGPAECRELPSARDEPAQDTLPGHRFAGRCQGRRSLSSRARPLYPVAWRSGAGRGDAAAAATARGCAVGARRFT